MPPPDPESSDDDLLRRLRPSALLARGLTDPASAATPGPASSRASSSPSPSPRAGETGQAFEAATLAGLFPEFQIEGMVSRGGFGTVYRAVHLRMRRPVAVKVLSSRTTRDVSAVARFEREIAAIGTLDHPGIVRAFDAGQRDGVWFLAMEWVDGVDFSTLSRGLGPLAPGEACELVRQAALALQHAHERQFVHRDVKPGNLMLAAVPGEAPRVKVLDFGLAQLVLGGNPGGELTVSGELLGTIDYVAPEQIENPRTVDARADVYGLGATLYRLLTGQAPHHAAGSSLSLYARLHRIAREPCPSIAVARPDLPSGLVSAVDRMLARDPALRWASASEVATVLAPFAEAARLPVLLESVPRQEPQSDPFLVGPPTSAARIGRVGRRVRPMVMLGGVVLMGLMVVLLFNRRTPEGRPAGAGGEEPLRTWVAGPALEQPQGLALGPDGSWYGATFWGGDFNQGGIFKYVAPTTVVALVHFTGTNGAALGHGGGRDLLLARDGMFYGVTEAGGRFDLGTLFRFDPRQEPVPFKTLVEFDSGNGAQPRAALIEDRKTDGILYGTTLAGGRGDRGTVFRLTVDGDAVRLETLIEFSGEGGEAPGAAMVSALVQVEDGTLYGMTEAGGSVGLGTIFKLTADGRFTSLVSFGQPPLNIYGPVSSLTVGRDGNLYGHCQFEGRNSGAAFRMTPAGAVEVLARFLPPLGIQPASTMFPMPDGSFYGTTFHGGPSGQGTVFRLTPEGGLTTVAAFTNIGPASDPLPRATPKLGPDGNLYGTTEKGGSRRWGTIYRLTPAGQLTTLVEFRPAKPARTGD